MDNDELLRIAAMYIGAPIRFFNPVTTEWGEYRKMTPSDLRLIDNGHLQWEMLLKSVENMPDSDALEIGKIQDWRKGISTSHPDAWHYQNSLKYMVKGELGLVYEFHQWLTANFYSVPIYFSPLHWANGKSPVDLGIAIIHPENVPT